MIASTTAASSPASGSRLFLKGDPKDHHRRTGILDDRCRCRIAGGDRSKVSIVHQHQTDYTVEDQSPPERWLLSQLPPAVFQLSFGNSHKQHDAARTKHAEERKIHRVECTFLEKILRRKPAPRPHDACCHNEKNSDKMHRGHLLL